jgi:inner membrane protein
MASLGHIAVGMAASRIDAAGPRIDWRPAAAWAALSMLPDADVIGLSLGIPYGSEWGHRGATHAFAFALVVGAVIGVAARYLGRPGLWTGVVAVLVLASHPVLDTLTNGGSGCALFWPFDHTRYFAPWRPIPVSPIGLSYLSRYGMYVAVSELIIFSPVIAFALWQRRT